MNRGPGEIPPHKRSDVNPQMKPPNWPPNWGPNCGRKRNSRTNHFDEIVGFPYRRANLGMVREGVLGKGKRSMGAGR